MLQDFSGQNLRGRSFEGQNLEGANFSGADIRGADFTNAILKDANFKGAEAGVNQSFNLRLLLSSGGLPSALAGFLPFFVAVSLVNISKTTYFEKTITVIVCLFVLAIFAIVTIYKGLTAGSGIIVVIGTLAGSLSLDFTHSLDVAFSMTSALVIPYAFAIALAFGVAYDFIFMYALCGIKSSRHIKFLSTIVAGGSAFIISNGSVVFAFLAYFFVYIVVLLGEYIGRRSLAGDKKDDWLRSLAMASCARGGTNFYEADLTNSDFTQALLQNTNFGEAILTRTCFYQARMLDCVRPGKSYLREADVRDLLVTGEGSGKNFDRQNLRGINLQAAKLVNSSFIGADFSEANLQDTDLSRANLVQTQLDGTDFTGATLTGAFIQDWGITSKTKFDGVRCEYIYMRQPTKDNPEPYRKPDNREEVFKDGDFGDFIQPIFDTLDLYHNQGVDPRAIAIAFKQLAEKNPNAELEIVAMEKRGQDKFLLRTKTASTANKSELSGEYFDNYNYLKSLPPEEQIKHFLTELKIKDNQINLQTNQILSYTNMISAALGRPSIQAENYNNHGDTMSQSPKKQSTFNMQNAQFGGGLVDADTVNAHQIGGNITNYTTEQKQNLAQAAAEIQQLLTQLEQTNPTTTRAQKMAVVTKAVDEIEKNPTLKARVVGALKSGGVEALKEALDHPLVNVFIAAVDGWQDAN